MHSVFSVRTDAMRSVKVREAKLAMEVFETLAAPAARAATVCTK